MSKQSLILSANGLKNVLIDKEEDFIFVIGENEIKMNHIFAEFVSPTVSHIHRSDPTVKKINLMEHLYDKELNEYEEKIIKSLHDKNVVSSLIEISRGERVEIENETEKKKLLYLSILLGNEELFDLLEALDYGTNEEKSLEESLFELVFYQRMNLRFDIERYQKKLNDISSRITAKDSEFLINLPTDLLYCILNNEHFNYDNEDFIFDIINEHFSKQNQNPNCNHNRNYHSNSNYYINNNHQYTIYEFYEKIQLCELSLKKFESMISNLNYSEITQGIWEQLVELILTNKTTNPKSWKTKTNGRTIEYDDDPNHRFNGIIHHLQNNCNTNNLHDSGIINVTSKSVKGNYFPKNAIEFDSYNYFFSLSGFDWLKYDFKDRKICPTSYSIKTRFDDDRQNPVNWCIEVSNTGGDDDEEWRVIDSRSGVPSVSKHNQADTFRIQLQLTNEESYRYIRLRSTGKTSGRCSCLAISSLEYFGTLYE